MATTEKAKIDRALEELLCAIDDGAEFPDAAYRAAVKNGVDQAALEAAYDEHDQKGF